MKLNNIAKLLLFSLVPLGQGTALHAANPIPPDPEVRTGTLDNGLTYYIRHNATPAAQADFFIAQRVGSINENDDQQGLAHFLEHMCFNGTEHFPGNSLISYLESLGVKFGKNLNAYTSTDETVYNICSVPTGRASALDSCVMILSDWSGRLLLDGKDIDEERGVILGEMRQRSTPASRILTRLAPEIYEGGIYGRRMPIGTAEIVSNFSHETLRDYYRRWYHPANQAVIIVGDIDPDAMEAAVRRHFADLKNRKGAITATRTAVPDNAAPIVVTGSDPEQSSDMVQIYIKEPEIAEADAGTIEEIRTDYIRSLIVQMLVERMDGIEAADPACPWNNLGIGSKHFLVSNTRDALMFRATADDAVRARKAITAFNTELLRAALHGFTDTELTRAKLSLRSERNKALANADVEKNTELARRYVAHFTRGGVIPSTRQLYKMMQGVERTTTLENVNAYFADAVRPDGRNRVTCVYATEADAAALAPDVLKADAAAIDIAAIEPYTDSFAGGEILASKPAPGTIVADEEGPFASRVLTLSNGIKVYLRPSDAKPDQVMIHAVSPGGFAMNYDPARKGIYKMTDDVLGISAFGGHSSGDLRKLLAGRQVQTAVKIGNTDEELIAVTAPADLEAALQVLYIKATAAGRDDIAFNALMSSTRSKLGNPVQTATKAMGDSIHSYVYNRHPLGEKLRAADLDAVDYDSILALHRDRFGDMSDFTFIVTGNFNTDSVKPLLEAYVASLPAAGRKERPAPMGYGFYSGEGKHTFSHPMTEHPQSITYSFFNGECPYDLEHIILAQTFGSILKSRLLAEVREKRGLTYGINSHCSVTAGFDGPDTPSRFIMPVYIKVTPGHEEEVFGIVRATVADLTENGPDAEEIAKVQAFLLKDIAENRLDNGYWETVLKVYDQYGPDMDSGYESIVESLTPERIREFGRTFVKGADHVELSMLPAE